MAHIRQSDLKLWQSCPLKYRYSKIDRLPRTQSASLTFGTILHDCVLYMEVQQDLVGAIARFHGFWNDPDSLEPGLKIDYYVRGTNWLKYRDEGVKVLTDWWGIIQWDHDVTLGREHRFSVPIGDGHTLDGTIDKLAIRYVAKIDQYVLLISDYKTNRKRPTYDWLADDLQFTAYAYATTRPEFWATFPNGAALSARVANMPRHGEWVGLIGPNRLDAGERTDVQYRRLTYAINMIAESIALRVFVPTISGESCRFCEWRDKCGLPEIPE